MNIRKLIIIGCTALSAIVNVSDVKAADPVTISVTGRIIASPCEIKSDSVNINVDLGMNIEASSLQAPGSATGWVPVDVNLINCPSATTKATILFQGTADSLNPNDMYRNTGTATNLAVQLQGVGGEPFGNGKSYTGIIVGNAYSYHLRARAWTQIGNVMPGTISAVVTATFTYQ